MSVEDTSRPDLLADFRRRFGFEDFPPDKLDLAFTHSSFANEENLEADNERLEFLGDAVLGAACSEFLFDALPEAEEGELSKRRSRLVSRTALGERAEEMGIGALMLLGRGERKSGGRRRRSLLGCALEALVGVVYRERGYEAADRFVRDHVIQPMAEPLGEKQNWGDYKTALQEWAQKERDCLPVYRKVGDAGPDHDRAFTVEVEVAGKRLARGEGRRIKAAETEAARKALELIEGVPEE